MVDRRVSERRAFEAVELARHPEEQRDERTLCERSESRAAGCRRRGLLGVSLGLAIAILAIAPANAARSRRDAGTRVTVPTVALNQVHVLGDRPAPFALDAVSAILLDVKTGSVLYSYNEHQKMQPASLAKIMTFFLVLDAIKQGRITPDTKITISESAWRLSMDQTLSHMFLPVGQQVAVNDLLYGLMVSSGDDAAAAFGEYLGGSTEGFAQQMNQKAQELGLSESHFVNPHGLPVEGEYVTASDMAKLGRALIETHPEALNYTSTKDFTFANIHQPNFNALLFHDSRVNGIKTGHVQEAGYHLVASATSNGMTLVSAVMGTKSESKRRDETEKLLDWGFRSFETYQPHVKIPATMLVYDGMADTVAIAPAQDVYVTLWRGEEKRVSVAFTPATNHFEAPVDKGAAAGQVVVTVDDKPYATIPVVTQAAVKRAGFLKRLRDRIRRAL